MLRPWNHICKSRSTGVSAKPESSLRGRLLRTRGGGSASRRRVASRSSITAATESLETRQLLAATPIAGLSDEFDDSSSIADWQRVNEVEGWNADQLRQWDVNQTQAGRMTMTPETVVWYGSWRGPMTFKEVTGDFVFTTQVHVTDRDDVGGSDADDVPGDGQYSLGGVMIRTPRDITNPETDWTSGSLADDGTNDGENYVFLSLGYGALANEFSLEVKTTRNSNSQLELTPLGQDASVINVQTARIGTDVFTLYQRPGEEWQVHRRYSRPDMPETIQVGLVTYTDWDKANDFDPFYHNGNVLTEDGFNPTPNQPFNPDLVAGFEYARYVRPDVPDALSGINLLTQATDAQLLTFLGDASNIAEDDPVVDPPVTTGVVTGTVFDDRNDDGIQASDEPGLPGVTIYADLNRNNTLDDSEPTVTTNDAGQFVLADLALGLHDIRVVIPSGFETTDSQTGTFDIEVIVSDGFESASTSFNLEVANTAPELSIADQSATSGVPLEVALPTVDADGQLVTYTVEVLGNELSALDAEHGFWSEGNYYDNYLGRSERWIRDADDQWHYLLPNGELHRWERSFEASPLIAELGSEVYDDPSLLTDPQAPPVTATIENGVLVITTAEGYVGEVQIRVTASDGYEEVTTTFSISTFANDEDDDLESVDNVYSEWDLLEV
jgi:hypothetical protein